MTVRIFVKWARKIDRHSFITAVAVVISGVGKMVTAGNMSLHRAGQYKNVNHITIDEHTYSSLRVSIQFEFPSRKVLTGPLVMV